MAYSQDDPNIRERGLSIQPNNFNPSNPNNPYEGFDPNGSDPSTPPDPNSPPVGTPENPTPTIPRVPSAPSTQPTAPQDWSQGPWDAARVSDYFTSRGVAPNGSSPDYWAGKWNEWGQSDPGYFLSRLSTADEFNPGGTPSQPGSTRRGIAGLNQQDQTALPSTLPLPSATPIPQATQTPSIDYSRLMSIFGAPAGGSAALSGTQSQLIDQLMRRAGQGTTIDPNDPIIKGQTDAFKADADRSGRSYLSQLAEKSGPNANIGAETRSVAEHTGQATGALHSQLMQQELTSRRNEIQSALSEAGNLIPQEQQIELQRQLDAINASLGEQQIGNTFGLGSRGLDLQQAGLGNQFGLGVAGLGLTGRGQDIQNSQFLAGLSQQDRQFLNNLALQYAGLQSGNDQFAANLDFNRSDRGTYWDWLNRTGGGS